MVKSEIICGSGANTFSLDLTTEIPISLNYNIADIKQPDKRNGAYSKSVSFLGTKLNNRFFEFTFEVNSVTYNFNPNLKTPCVVYADGIEVISGNLQLISISKIHKNKDEYIVYQCCILGENNTLFQAISDNKLEDLDFSKYNHTYSKAVQKSSISNNCYISGVLTACSNGQGYRYPLIDYGYNSFLSNSYDVEHLRPALFAKEYWDKIFAIAGKTYTSSFLSNASGQFCKMIIPNNDEQLALSAAVRANYEFYAGDNGGGSAQNFPLTTFGGGGAGATVNDWGRYSSYYTTQFICKFNDDTTAPFIDTGGNYNTSNGQFTVGVGGNYALKTDVNFQVKLNTPATTASYGGVIYNWAFACQKSTDGGATWSNLFYQSLSDPTTITTSYTNHTFSFSFPSTYMAAGQKFRVAVYLSGSPYQYAWFKDGGGSYITAGTASYDMKLMSTATFRATLTDAKILDGQALLMNSAIPKDIKQKDFLMSIIRMFNLYMDVDPSNPNNFIIEPRDTFYTLGNTLDWTSKWAIDKPTDIKPMGEIDSKIFEWRYKEDQDYFNKDYQARYTEAYGSKKVIISNDFLKNTNKTEVIFSATEIVDNPTNDLITPKIFDFDGTIVKPMKHNIRILYWLGSQTTTVPYSWTSTLVGTSAETVYGGTAMINSITSPTESIEWGVPNQVYYSAIYYTANNLYNTKYSRMINEITDRDSKIVTLWLLLEPSDIKNFKFSDIVFIEDTYYYVNKIIDYNPLVTSLTKVELLKLKTYGNYIDAEIIGVNVPETNLGDTGITSRVFGNTGATNVIGTANNNLVGENVSSRSSGGTISGKNISVAQSCYKISIISSDEVAVSDSVSGLTVNNCSGILVGASGSDITLNNCKNLIIEPGVYSYQGFGVSNKTITQSDSNTTEIGSVIKSVALRDYTPSGSAITIDSNYDLIFFDATAGNQTGFLPDPFYNRGRRFNLYRKDATANTVTITPYGAETINGASTLSINTQYYTYTLTTDGTNWYII